MSKEPTPQQNARPDPSESDPASVEALESRLSASSEAGNTQNGDATPSGDAGPLVAAAGAAEIAARAARAAHQTAADEQAPAVTASGGSAASDGADETSREAPEVSAAARPVNPLFSAPVGAQQPADGDTEPSSDEVRPRTRAPRFPPGAARPGVDTLPPAYGGPLSGAAASAGAQPMVDAPSNGAHANADRPTASAVVVGGDTDGDSAAFIDGEAAAHATVDAAAPTSGVAAAHATVDAAAHTSEDSVAPTAAGDATAHSGAEADTDAAADTAGNTAGAGDGRGGFWRRRPVIIAGTIVAGLLVLYGAAYAIAGSSLASNASVLGVDIGGMSPEDAEATLAAELPPLVDEPVDVLTDDGDFTLTPSESGLTVDIAATVQSVPGGSANPVSLVRALFGGGEVTPVAAVDREALTSAIEVIAEQVGVEPVNGSIGFDDGDIATSEAETGSAMDVAATADTFEEVYFGVDGTAYTLPLDPVATTINPVEPAVTDDDVAQTVADFAEPAMSGPVTVAAGDHEIEITPTMLSEALSVVTSDDGVLTPELDGDALAAAADDVLSEVSQPGRDATIEIQDGAPVIVPEESGIGVVPEDLAAAVLPALTESGSDRSASVEFDEIQPEFTAADAEALGVTEESGGEVIGSWRTEFDPGQNAYRNTNIGQAASKIHNTLLLPGDTFSLNGLVGERTAANGFAVGAIISGGQLIQDYGGGVSQVATTSYHAAYLAGLEDVEHRPHTIYYSHYPVGAEATVSWGNFDMAFKNDTPYGVLVETKFSPAIPGKGTLEVLLWSTKHFEVETSTSERSDFTSPPSPTYNSSANCYPNTPSQGFSVTTYRKVWDPDGDLVKDESYPWVYRPSPEVRCGEEP